MSSLKTISPKNRSNVIAVSPNNHLLVNSCPAKVVPRKTINHHHQTNNGLRFPSQGNSPLSPLPPLEHPSSFCFSPAILRSIRSPSTVPDAATNSRANPINRSTSTESPTSSKTAAANTGPRGRRKSMLPLRPLRPKQLIKVLNAHSPKRPVTRTRRSICNESDCTSPICIRNKPVVVVRPPAITDMTVAQILLKSKLQHLVPLFEREEIDMIVLQAMTVDDMDQLGICTEDQVSLIAVQKRLINQLRAMWNAM